MSIGNKRVSQLVELTANELAGNDLLLVIDVTAKESKKTKLSEFSGYLKNSGSVAFSDTASYILGSNVYGAVIDAISSSYSQNSSQSLNSINSINTISASYSLTSSYSLNIITSSQTLTSSYLNYSGFPNGTASYAINSDASNISSVSSYLLYFNADNGTASYSIKTENVDHADTSSYLDSTASIALHSLSSDSASLSATSQFLILSPNNGTASYALSAGNINSGIIDYGMFLSDTQSLYISQLDVVDVLPFSSQSSLVNIESIGTLMVSFTSSIPINGTVYLSVIDRNVGSEILLDSTPVSINISPTVGNWGNYNSGTVKIPFSLMGQSSLYGSYMAFVSSSDNIQIEPSRTVRFNIGSKSDIINEYVSEPINFITTPNTSTMSFTSTDGGPFTGTSSDIVTTGSYKILTINANNIGVSSMRYVWSLNNLTNFTCSNNPSLVFLSGLPNSLIGLSCFSCSLSILYPLNSSSMTYLDCSSNTLSSLPTLPSTMSYLECSSNNINLLPDPLPYGLTTLLCSSNQITGIAGLPDTIVTMSFDNNYYNLDFSEVILPSQLTSFSLNNVYVNSLGGIPGGLVYLSIQSCSLATSVIGSITYQLISNSQISGSVDMRGNGPPDPTSLSYIMTLQSNGWTILYDVI